MGLSGPPATCQMAQFSGVTASSQDLRLCWGGGGLLKNPLFFGGGPLLELNCRRDINHFEEYVILPMNNTRKYYELLYYALNPLVLV